MTQLRKLFGGYLMLVPAFLAVPDLKRQEGQTLAEYALILALIAVVVVLVVATLGGTIRDLFTSASNSI
jgi:Flp pilus assembly pilin Flp